MNTARFALFTVLLCSVPGLVFPQIHATSSSKIAAAKPAPLFSGEVVLDTNKVRVLRVASADALDAVRARVSADSVLIPLSKLSLKLADEPTQQLNAGEARFLAAKSIFELTLPVGEPSPFIAELKGDWSARLETCTEPKTCVRPIKVSQEEIGQSRLLFKNGYLTATLYTLLKGASLTSSYFAARGTDYILFMPLTDVHVNFSGTDEDLKRGQPYFCSGTEIEVSSPRSEAVSWMVLRIHIPG